MYAIPVEFSIYIYISFQISFVQCMQHFMEGHAKSGPISRLPLITISDSGNLLRDVPVCQVTSTIMGIITCLLVATL